MYHVLFFKTNSMKIQSIQNTICDISLSTSERFLCFSNSSSVSIIWHFFPQLSFPHRRHIIHIQIILNIPRIVSIHSCVLYTILLAKCPPPQGSFFFFLLFYFSLKNGDNDNGQPPPPALSSWKGPIFSVLVQAI